MTIRALFLGLLLALGIAAGWYFNDWIIQQTFLVGHALPVSVFGVIVLLVLVINPVMARIHRSLPLQPREIGIIALMGLAVCGWCGSGYLRYLGITLAMPSHWHKTKPAWQANNITAYVPGGSQLLGEGHIIDWTGLAQALVQDAAAPGPSVGKNLWQRLPVDAQSSLQTIAATQRATPQSKIALFRQFNKILADPAAFADIPPASLPVPAAALTPDTTPVSPALLPQLTAEKNNRTLLVAAYPRFVLPPPRGQGVLLLGGRSDPVITDPLEQGWPGGKQITTEDVATLGSAWWPTLRLWLGFALACAAALLGLTLVVHPQWARREQLPYPIPRFVDEITKNSQGSWLPDVARNRLFWIALGCILLLHLANGLKVWYPGSIFYFQTRFDFSALRTLLPNSARVPMSDGMFYIALYPTVIAFAFFLTAEVSFSLGVSLYAWVLLGVLLNSYGIGLSTARPPNAPPQDMVMFGVYAGMILTTLYIGRRHYWDVAKSVVGLPRPLETPAYSVWGGRGFILSFLLAVLILHTAGCDWVLGVMIVSLILMQFVVVARANAETGMLAVQAIWVPFTVLATLLGTHALGPTGYILIAMPCMIFGLDMREAIMTHLVNALEIGDRTVQRPPRAIAPLLACVSVIGLGVGLLVTMFCWYRFGLSTNDTWSRVALGQWVLDRAGQVQADLAAVGNLESAMQLQGLGRLPYIHPDSSSLAFAGVGLGLVLLATVARLRLPWWPIHPVLFVFWGNHLCRLYAMSFLAGWFIKTCVLKLTGSKGYHTCKPLMVGVIAGELLAAVLWMMAGVLFYLYTGQFPMRYQIFPV